MSLGPMARCKHCGVVSLDEALACEEGDCDITDWRVPAEPRRKKLIGSGHPASPEHSDSTHRSEAKKSLLESQTIDQAKEDVITLFAVYRNANNQDWQRVARLIEPAIDALIAAVRRSGEPT